MSEAKNFQLQRFYYGTLVADDGRVSPTPGVIARTAGITPAHVAECLRAARLAPPLPGDTGAHMPGAFGLFRGEAIDFILVKAQRNQAGYPQLLFILIPAQVLRVLEGNLLTFRSLALMDMPFFSSIRRNLVPFELEAPGPVSPDEQADLLLDLLIYCQDAFKTVEGLLSSVIHGQALAIVNSPASVEQRLRFVQALLALLPVPARTSVTFATYVNAPQASPAQIKFLSSYAVPEQHAVFDWGNARLLTPVPDHPYSAYIVRQLRLDAANVVEQTQELARRTVWRARHREDLSTALAWVSRRAAIDQTVRDGQPVDRKLVASVLREDPTLPDDLRLVYARHLLAMTLATGDLPAADALPTIAVSSEDVAAAINVQLQVAIQNGQADTVYTLLQRWILGVPDTSAAQWRPRLQDAARTRLSEMLDRGDIESVVEFLNSLARVHPALGLDDIIPDLIGLAQRASRARPALAQAVFLLAAETQPPGDFHRLLADAQIVSQLPAATQTAIDYLRTRSSQPSLPHILDYGARAFGDGHRMVVMARFVEWALLERRIDLVDTNALQGLLAVAQADERSRYTALIQHLVDDFKYPAIINALEPPGPRVLIQLLLQTGDYGRAIEMLEFLQNSVYRSERFDDQIRLALEVFMMAPLTPDRLQEALTYLEGSQIQPEPRAAIYCGALINRQWAVDQDYAARRLTTMVFNDNHLIEVVGQDHILNLLAFHARQTNALDALRVGAALIDHLLATGRDGGPFVVRMWPHLTWDADVSQAAVELLRRYIRGARQDQVPVLLTYFTDELGQEIGQALQATLLMRIAMNNTSLMRFAEQIHVTTRLLIDLASAYHANKELPPNHRVRRDLDQMTGGLSEPERERLAQNLLIVLEEVYDLGREAARRRSATADQQLVTGTTSPQSTLDLLKFVGGHFSGHEAHPLTLEQEAMAHLFGTRSAAMFLRETDASVHLLDGLHRAFRNRQLDDIPPAALRSELESLWGTLSLYNQRRTQDQFAEDCQHLAGVIEVIVGQSSDRVLTSNGLVQQLESGQRQPRTALEALRWIHGYFARKHHRLRT